jgi:CheY-like chemotaxis protein
MKEVQILVVDDYPELRESLSDILAGENRRVFMAEDGLDALRVIEENDIKVVISDIMMPNMDGVELLRKIKERPLSPHVLLISGFSQYTRQQVIEAGGIDLIDKPIQINELMRTIDELIAA